MKRLVLKFVFVFCIIVVRCLRLVFVLMFLFGNFLYFECGIVGLVLNCERMMF